jgi:hypothetical protein
MEGFIVPPISGDFIFYLGSDDNSKLFMNTNAVNSEDPAGAQMLMEETGCCAAVATHPSPVITLTAGQRYYVNGLWKEGVGGDYMIVVAKLAADPTDPNALPALGPEYIGTYVNPDILSTIVPTLPTSGMRAIGSMTQRGFDLHLVQVATPIANSIAVAEQLLAGVYPSAGSPAANVGRVPLTSESGIINYSIEVSSYGSIPSDAPFPGIPGTTGSTDNMAMEALTFVELHKGLHCMIVNSDDDFRVSPAECVTDPNNSITLGVFDSPGGRGATDSPFVFNVPQDGLYPMRLVWQQGAGGANVEWVDIQPGGYPSRFAVNANDTIKAFAPGKNRISFTVSGGNLIISWGAKGPCPAYRLQGTAVLANPSSATIWNNIPGASPVSVPIGGGNQFFRLISP